MKLVECKAELIQQGEGLDGLYRHIETCGRVPYKSEAKSDGTVEGAKAFVDRIIASKHGAVLEHGTVYLQTSVGINDSNFYEVELSPYSRNNLIDNKVFVTTNLRVIVGLLPNTYQEFLNKYMCNPTENHAKRYTFKVLTSIGVTREVNRSRSLSMLEMSTRYCNFSKDKFDNQVSFCKPSWLDLNLGIYEVITNDDGTRDIVGDGYIKDVRNYDPDNLFLGNCFHCEDTYMNLLESGWKPQQAREILPLCTATEAVYTGFAEDWKHFFNLRFFETTGKVHPNMMELSTKMREECEKAGIWNNIIKDNNEN